MGLISNVRFAVQRARGTSTGCTHIASIRDVAPASKVCDQCVQLGDTWVHLRMCMTCGQVGCCDSSKNKHAHRHADEVGHPLARSIEPGEEWLWCFVDETLVALRRRASSA